MYSDGWVCIGAHQNIKLINKSPCKFSIRWNMYFFVSIPNNFFLPYKSVDLQLQPSCDKCPVPTLREELVETFNEASLEDHSFSSLVSNTLLQKVGFIRFPGNFPFVFNSIRILFLFPNIFTFLFLQFLLLTLMERKERRTRTR